MGHNRSGDAAKLKKRRRLREAARLERKAAEAEKQGGAQKVGEVTGDAAQTSKKPAT
jgi:hypothetical protein